jgi:DNA-binding XRE family transcriptional regulator
MTKITGFRRSSGAARIIGTGKRNALTHAPARAKKIAKTPRRGKRDMVELPRAEYEAMVRRLEDLEDVRALDEARADPDREELPSEMVGRLLTGEESPLAVWREHRGMTQRALAAKSGVQPGYLSEIESGKKPGSVKALAAIARALDIRIEDLLA